MALVRSGRWGNRPASSGEDTTSLRTDFSRRQPLAGALVERGGDSCPAGGDDRDANFPVAAGFGQDWKETDMEERGRSCSSE